MMFKLFSLVTLFVLSSCGNEPIQSRVPNPSVQAIALLNYESSYPLERPIRLEFDLIQMDTDAQYFVSGYMKCCKSPLVLLAKQQSGRLIVDIEEFWSPGVYLVQVIAKNSSGKILSISEIDVEAR